jgi:hypothetical protein
MRCNPPIHICKATRLPSSHNSSNYHRRLNFSNTAFILLCITHNIKFLTISNLLINIHLLLNITPIHTINDDWIPKPKNDRPVLIN